MTMTNEIEPISFEKDTPALLSTILTNLFEGLTGIAASERKDWSLSLGHILQRMRGGQFLVTLLREWNQYLEKGRIKDDYQRTEQHKSCLQELLDFLDNDSPDELRFSAMKKIFLIAATEEVSDRNGLLPYQYMRICRSLSSGELIVLNSCYRLSGEDWWKNIEVPSTREWLKTVAKETGLDHYELVELHEDSLIKKKLFTARRYGDGSGVSLQPYYRLTQLGYEICRYIDHYEDQQYI